MKNHWTIHYKLLFLCQSRIQDSHHHSLYFHIEPCMNMNKRLRNFKIAWTQAWWAMQARVSIKFEYSKFIYAKQSCWQVYNIFFKQSSLKLQRIEKAVELLTLSSQGAPKSMEEASKKRYQFWETQPVPKISKYSSVTLHQSHKWGSHGRDRMVIGFTTTYAIGDYHL